MTKDSRVDQSTCTKRIWGNTLDASALASIDALLAAGDTNGALLVINMVSNGLNGDMSQVNTSLHRPTCCGRFNAGRSAPVYLLLFGVKLFERFLLPVLFESKRSESGHVLWRQ